MTIIIPSRNAANLVACVRAIRKAGETARIIVIDDGVNWQYVDTLPGSVADRANMEIWVGIKPFSFARNVNIGIRAAEQNDVILLNDDALLESPQGFSQLQRSAVNNPEYGIIGAVTNVTGQPLQQRLARSQPCFGLRSVGHIAFVAVLIPRWTLNRIGLLDDRFGSGSYEDRDYCERVTQAGLKVGVHDACYVDHGALTSTFRGAGGPGYNREAEGIYKAKWGIASREAI